MPADNHRLYVKARHISYQRGKRNVNPNTSLVQIVDKAYNVHLTDVGIELIEGVSNPCEAQFYLGKRVAFVYRATREVRGSKIRVIWGKITRPHGNSGIVRAKFRSNLPPKSFGASLRVMLYPSNI